MSNKVSYLSEGSKYETETKNTTENTKWFRFQDSGSIIDWLLPENLVAILVAIATSIFRYRLIYFTALPLKQSSMKPLIKT